MDEGASLEQIPFGPRPSEYGFAWHGRGILISITAKPLARSLLALSLSALSALLAFGPNAAARNIFEGFTKAPTFTPPPGCVPGVRTYGVMSRCDKVIEPGRTFYVLIDTAVGTFGGGDMARNSTYFVKDHVAEIKAYWKERHPTSRAFTSKASDIVPANAPRYGTRCREYSITVETKKAIEKRRVPAVMRVEGLTCAWPVERPAHGKSDVEIFWLEAYDEYAPSVGQKPMENFDSIVRNVFESARL